ncbi:DUF2812 domain-containing protein [Thalassobacillus hwangdonensis]|uniref:DUF2812 domain-containing protein n=1 Tax=Thalassobacillus hwangdonensis TaxID=546108 RepID=A0ABW3L0X5_9BACI
MIKRVWKPFWSFDVERTEDWLADMAGRGFSLVDLHPRRSLFIFEAGEPRNTVYQLDYKTPFTSTMQEGGWEEITRTGKWNVMANHKEDSKIRIFSTRDNVLSRNQKLMYVFVGLFIYLLLTLSFPFLFLFFSLLSGEDLSISVVGSPMWLITITVGIFLWTTIPYGAVKLYRANKRMVKIDAPEHTSEYFIRKKRTAKRYDRTKPTVTKYKFAWQYAPDRLEEWLGEMAQKGYQLVRVRMGGVRYQFVQDSEEKITYAVDYHGAQRQGYFDLHQEAGWALIYTSASMFNRWCIWAKSYEEEAPEFFSDQVSKLKHARKVTLTQVSVFAPLSLAYMGLVWLTVNTAMRDGMSSLDWYSLIIYTIVILEFSIFSIRALMYYRRMKRKVALA